MHQLSYHTIGEVAAMVGEPRWRLAYLIERDEVPGPSLQVPGRHLFTDEDVEKIRRALENRPCRRGRQHAIGPR